MLWVIATGMRKEVKSTFYAYIVMMLSLALCVISAFWILMEFKVSCIATFVFCLGMLQWWTYCVRIYNRFFVNPIIEAEDLDFEGSSTNSSRLPSQASYTGVPVFDREHSGLDRVNSTTSGLGRMNSTTSGLGRINSTRGGIDNVSSTRTGASDADIKLSRGFSKR
jgi:hypothetical protein